MSKMETGDFEIRPEPFAPARVVGTCCDLVALRAPCAEIFRDIPWSTDRTLAATLARLAGRRVLITAGPTFEPLDPVRGLTNRSSGSHPM